MRSQNNQSPKPEEANPLKLSKTALPYELKKGGIYVIEVKNWAMPREEAISASKYYKKRHNIDVQFIFTSGQDFALQAVPPETKPTLTNKQTHHLVMSSMSPTHCKNCGLSGADLRRYSCKVAGQLATDSQQVTEPIENASEPPQPVSIEDLLTVTIGGLMIRENEYPTVGQIVEAIMPVIKTAQLTINKGDK